MRDSSRRLAGFLALLIAVTSLGVYPMVTETEVRDPWQVSDMTFQVNVTVQNLGQNPAEDIPLRLAIPLADMADQERISWSSSVEPERTSQDALGNEFLHFVIPDIAPGGEAVVQLEIQMRMWSVDYDVEPDMVGSDDGTQDIWLAESQYINVNEASIQDLAAEIAADETWVVDIGWETYAWIIENVHYQQVAGEADARTTLRNMEGGSAEFGNLFVALMRANDIPARRLSGWGAHFTVGEELPIHRFSHGWTEFHLPNVGWLNADPTWGLSNQFDNFANSDDAHITMTRGAGVHYLWRGPYSAPFGDTDVDTDYSVLLLEQRDENLSVIRTVLSTLLFVMPVIFAVSVVLRVRQQNADVNIDLAKQPVRIGEARSQSDEAVGAQRPRGPESG